MTHALAALLRVFIRRQVTPDGVGQHVPPQVTVPPEDGTAGGTFVGFQVRVSEEVSLEVAPLVEAPPAGWALVGRLLHVEDLVDGQRAALAEAFATLAAFERLLLAVDVPEKDKTGTSLAEITGR